jgi:hypothetical protein
MQLCETQYEEILEAFDTVEPSMRPNEQTTCPWVNGQQKEEQVHWHLKCQISVKKFWDYTELSIKLDSELITL